MIKLANNYEAEQVLGGCDSTFNFSCLGFVKGDNVTLKTNASFVYHDGKTAKPHKWLFEPGTKCTIQQIGSKSMITRNGQLLLGTCYNQYGQNASSDILSWVMEEQVDKA